MFSAEQLAQLTGVRETAAETSWADKAREAVSTLQADLLGVRCSATIRNLASLAEVTGDGFGPGTVVSHCAAHNSFHMYAEGKARGLATTLAVNAQSLLATAEAEIPAPELTEMRAKVVHAQHAFFAAVAADRRAIADYRKFEVGTRSVTGAVLPAQPVKRTPNPVKVKDHSPIQARREQAARVLAETGITDTQLVRFYRCYRKHRYETVAAAVLATLLVHEAPQRMGVYLCACCTYLHIGHRSQYGETLNPAFFTRAIEKWHAEPEIAARFIADLADKTR